MPGGPSRMSMSCAVWKRSRGTAAPRVRSQRRSAGIATGSRWSSRRRTAGFSVSRWATPNRFNRRICAHSASKVNFLAALIGRVRGGLSYVLLGAMYLVSGISGSKAVDMAAVAPILFPEMLRRGAHSGELASLLATPSAMSETIPPSLVLITIGSVTNLTIVALFTGGLLPAFVAALGLVVVAWFRARGADTGVGTRAPAMLMARTFVIAGPRSDPIRHSRRSHWRSRHRYRGLDRRRCLHRLARAVGLSPVRV